MTLADLRLDLYIQCAGAVPRSMRMGMNMHLELGESPFRNNPSREQLSTDLTRRPKLPQ